jgi:hypothetical protein
MRELFVVPVYSCGSGRAHSENYPDVHRVGFATRNTTQKQKACERQLGLRATEAVGKYLMHRIGGTVSGTASEQCREKESLG